MTRASNRHARVLVACALAALAGCASTQVSNQTQYGGSLPRPHRILVYPFATSPDEVQLDRSPTAEATWALQGIPASTERQDVARAEAAALADHLVQKIQAQGLPAERGYGPPDVEHGPVLVIDGHFLAIQEGSRAERVVIGLGAGRSEVRTAVRVVEMKREGRRLVDQFEVEAQSGRKPGMAETMGAGAAAGQIAASAAVSAAGAVASEAFGDDVEADAERTASKIASMLGSFFAQQGWIPPQAAGM